jgi:hypothetical protein
MSLRRESFGRRTVRNTCRGLDGLVILAQGGARVKKNRTVSQRNPEMRLGSTGMTAADRASAALSIGRGLWAARRLSA